MFEEFYEMYEPEEQEVVALINRCIGGGYNNKGGFWQMTVVTLGMVFCDTGKVTTKEERLEWPVTDEERNSDKGWERFQNEQICRLKIRRMKEEWAKDLVAWPWCISQVVKAHEDCPELQTVLDEYHKPVVLQDQVLGELTLGKFFLRNGVCFRITGIFLILREPVVGQPGQVLGCKLSHGLVPGFTVGQQLLGGTAGAGPGGLALGIDLKGKKHILSAPLDLTLKDIMVLVQCQFSQHLVQIGRAHV